MAPPPSGETSIPVKVLTPDSLSTNLSSNSGSRNNTMPSSSPSSSPVNEDDFEVGGQVLTQFGRGRILQVRSKQVKVQILPWRLADADVNKVIVCIRNDDIIFVLSKCRANAMNAKQKREYVQALKDAANYMNHTQRYGNALDLYRKTIAVVTVLLQETKTPAFSGGAAERNSAERADWLVTVVRCSNQAASICLRLDLLEDCMSLTRNAMLVLDALQGDAQQAMTPPPPAKSKGSLGSNKAVGGGLKTDTTSVSSSSEDERSQVSIQEVGQVRLFGECRIQALIHMGTALLQLEQAHAAKKTCESAQQVLLKYSGPEYLERSEYKPILKRLVGLQKQIKAVKKQAKKAIKSQSSGASEAAAATAAMKALGSPENSRTRKISWFDDTPKKKKNSTTNKKKPVQDSDDDNDTERATSISSWYERPSTVLAYSAIIVGTIVVAKYLLNRRRVR